MPRRFALSAFVALATLLLLLSTPVGPALAQAPALSGDSTSTGANGEPVTFNVEEAEDPFRVQTLEPGSYLDYDEGNGLLYAPQRTRVVYRDASLEADTLKLNVPARQIEAFGNVVLVAPDGSEIRAERLLYDFSLHQGKAFQAEGRYDVLYFRHAPDETEDTPTFERLSESQVRLLNARLTTCDFEHPMYYVRAREILIYPDARVFMKGATLYVRDFPVFYFPVFTRSLEEGSPWFTQFGYDSDLGAYGRIGYEFKFRRMEPSFEDDDKLVTTRRANLDVFADFLSKRGFGGGIWLDYELDRGRHHGELDFYAIGDGGREARSDEEYSVVDRTRDANGNIVTLPGTRRTESDEDDDGIGRYQLLLKHRSELTENLTLLANVDWLSDPELYDEILDKFSEDERGRVMERRARAALTLTREYFVARLLFDITDRIGRDRLSDYSDPGDRARDFDEQPNIVIKDREDRGLPHNRWGHAGARAPQLTVSTTWLRLWNTPLHYYTELNLFNALDRGLNTIDGADDAWVQGGDWYHALMWRWRLSRRYTLMAKVGGGGGFAHRADDEYRYFEGENRTYPLILHNSEGGLEFLDEETFLIGTEEFRYDQVEEGFGYADALLRLNARFTNALTGNLSYRYRAATEDSLGDWYAEMGNHHLRSDLYNFKLRENNLRADLRYMLFQPRLLLYASAWFNFVAEDELYPNEKNNNFRVGGNWTSQDQTLALGANVDLFERMIYHPSDINAFMDSSLDWRLFAEYRPLSKLWWARAELEFRDSLDREVGDKDRDRFTENDTFTELETELGARIGPKWKGHVGSRWDSRAGSFRELDFTLERDLHNAMLLMFVGFEQDIYDDEGEDDNEDDRNNFMDQMDFRIALSPKLPGQDGQAPRQVPGITALEDRSKSPQIEGF